MFVFFFFLWFFRFGLRFNLWFYGFFGEFGFMGFGSIEGNGSENGNEVKLERESVEDDIRWKMELVSKVREKERV
jgi:hypothetical protein